MKTKWLSILSLALISALLFVAAGCSLLSTGGGRSVLSMLGRGEGGEPTLDTIVAGLKEALQVGTDRTVASTSRKGGYLNDPRIRIGMPEKLESMASTLRKVGLSSEVDRFEQKMNEAAEQAARSATPVFLDAIKNMSFSDAKSILHGPDTAVTDYFRGKTSEALKKRYHPIVSEQMLQLGAVKTYQNLEQRYNQIPLVPKTSISVEDYVTDKALEGLFTVLAGEEKNIRQNPTARTTALLRQVFGGNK